MTIPVRNTKGRRRDLHEITWQLMEIVRFGEWFFRLSGWLRECPWFLWRRVPLLWGDGIRSFLGWGFRGIGEGDVGFFFKKWFQRSVGKRDISTSKKFFPFFIHSRGADGIFSFSFFFSFPNRDFSFVFSFSLFQIGNILRTFNIGHSLGHG